jgi:hypothetical protein
MDHRPVGLRSLVGRHVRRRREQQGLEPRIVELIGQRPTKAGAASAVEVVADRALAQADAAGDDAL